MTSLRERNRLNAKRSAQRAALAMFNERGYEQVTVSEIAVAAGMAASTVYRHFRTKEDIVLWDEHDHAIGQALTDRLSQAGPFQAMRDVFVETLGGRYDGDLDFQLARVQFIYATERLHAAAVEANLRNRVELTDGLRPLLTKRNRHAAAVLAGAALLAVDIAIERWQYDDAKKSLGIYLNESFDSLEALASIT